MRSGACPVAGFGALWRAFVMALLVALLAACAGPQAASSALPAAQAADPDFPVLLDRYVGILPCADCAGVYTELALYVRGSDRLPAHYALRETRLATFEGDRSNAQSGAWNLLRDAGDAGGQAQGDVLRLKAEGQAPRQFRHTGDSLLLYEAANAHSAILKPGLWRAGSPSMGVPLVITAADAGKPIVLAVGRELLVQLPEHRAGHAWSLAMPADGTLMARIADGPEGTAAPSWRLLAARPGRHVLRFEYRPATAPHPPHPAAPALRALAYPVTVY